MGRVGHGRGCRSASLGQNPSAKVDVAVLVALASEILTHRNSLQASFSPEKRLDGLKEILRVGTSAGGARAKAIIAWNPQTNQVRSGQTKATAGFGYGLLEEGGRRHFMTRRFDRVGDGGKLHMQSLAALAHFDFNTAGAYSYEQAFDVIGLRCDVRIQSPGSLDGAPSNDHQR